MFPLKGSSFSSIQQLVADTQSIFIHLACRRDVNTSATVKLNVHVNEPPELISADSQRSSAEADLLAPAGAFEVP